MTQPTPGDRARKQYEDAEKRAASSMESVVSSEGFAESLALFTSNAVALARVANAGVDQLVRATRLAGRRDITRLGRQIARTEDKLENVLVIVEGLEAELAQARRERDEARADANGTSTTSRAEAGSGRRRATRRSSAETLGSGSEAATEEQAGR